LNKESFFVKNNQEQLQVFKNFIHTYNTASPTPKKNKGASLIRVRLLFGMFLRAGYCIATATFVGFAM
jgi:hypothetical protein